MSLNVPHHCCDFGCWPILLKVHARPAVAGDNHHAKKADLELSLS